jgi:hypothetical protein
MKGIKHKHAELIHAWAEGAQIQRFNIDGWVDATNPYWDKDTEYRIKPKPDIISFLCVLDPSGIVFGMVGANLKLIFDGETGKLKKAEIL